MPLLKLRLNQAEGCLGAGNRRTILNSFRPYFFINMSEITITKESITPEIAATMLSKNPENRNVSKNKVWQLTQAMERGEFKFTHQGIALDVNGNLIDGQHRLSAIIKSGTTQQMMVTRNLPRDIIQVVDRSDKRTVAQEIQMKGLPNAVGVASTARMYAVWKKHQESLSEYKNDRMTESEIRAEINANLVNVVSNMCRYQKRFRLMPLTDWAFLWYVLVFDKKVSEETVCKFYEELSTGAGLQIGSPCLTLRSHITNNKTSGTTISAPIRIAKLIKTWNAWANNRQLKQIGYNQENDSFPKIQTSLLQF